MKLYRVVLPMLAVLASATAAIPAQAASGKPIPINRTTDLRDNGGYDNFGDFKLVVDKSAKLSPDGAFVYWGTRFTCPAGESWVMDLRVAQQDPPQVPELFGEDQGVTAVGQAVGTCTGKPENVTITLDTQPVRIYDPNTGTTTLRTVPLTYSKQSYYTFTLDFYGQSFSLVVCRMPACA